jgi:Tfp pilus assembly protein FimT
MACKKNKQGVTLIEAMVVLMLITIASGLVVFYSSYFNRTTMRSEIRKLHTICHYLRQSAIMENKPYTLTFNTQQHTYTYKNTQEQLPPSVRFDAIKTIKGPPSAPTHPITSAITFPNQCITFHPNGTMQSGTVYLTDKQQTYMCALTSPVSHVSFLRIYEHNGAWQQL